MLLLPSDSISEQLQPAALLCFLVSCEGLGPSAECHLPSAFTFPPVGCVWQWTVLCCILLGVTQPFLLEWFWQHSEKLQSPAIFDVDSSPNAPAGQDKFPKCSWIGQMLQGVGSSLCLDWTNIEICGFTPLSHLNISKYLNVCLGYLNLWIRNEDKLLRLQFSIFSTLKCLNIHGSLGILDQMLVPIVLYCLWSASSLSSVP